MDRDSNHPDDDDTFGLDAEFAPHPEPPWPERVRVMVERPAEGLLGYHEDVPRRPSRRARRAGQTHPRDNNLATVPEFAAHLNCAESSVYELLKLGLPSFKSPKIGRRILKAEAHAWLLNGGASRSRTAKKLASTSRPGKSKKAARHGG